MRVVRRTVLGGVLLGSLALFTVGGLVLTLTRAEGSTLTVIIGIGGALAIVALALRVDLSAAVRALEAARVFLPVVAYVLVSDLLGPTESTLQFDEVGAQVIVVLLLALAVESRFFRVNPEEANPATERWSRPRSQVDSLGWASPP